MDIREVAKPYLCPSWSGGHGVNSVGEGPFYTPSTVLTEWFSWRRFHLHSGDCFQELDAQLSHDFKHPQS
jgi:hypothetical protein